ncbi:MAG: TrkA family potassium uptake protein [Bacteroidales bacterium]|nr:TrkA family potassium uptake protein [Bacteroidales bacterium]
MMYVIIGLGTFGVSLGKTLNAMGNDVLGIDANLEKVEAHKTDFDTVCLNSTDENAMRSQQITEADAVIVAIGEDWAASVQTTALLLNMGVKNIIGRSLSPLHDMVLRRMGVTNIVNPEETAARSIAYHLMLENIVSTYNITDDVVVYEIVIPSYYVGQKVEQINLKREYNLSLIAIKHQVENNSITNKVGGMLGFEANRHWAALTSDFDSYIFGKDDHIYICGKQSDMATYMDSIKK